VIFIGGKLQSNQGKISAFSVRNDSSEKGAMAFATRARSLILARIAMERRAWGWLSVCTRRD
jgi:hypothetical protein